MRQSRHTAPLQINLEGEAHVLKRLKLGDSSNDRKEREHFIQDLIHRYPALIPMAEIEPAYTPLISVCMELETPAGYVDNVWITPTGAIVFGETKLVRNPQSRREVVAQVLDYASAVSRWSFEDFECAIRKARNEPNFSLWELVKLEDVFEEHQFIDSVQRRLVSGRILLLIVGDGIQEGVETLTDYLQLHAGLHVGLSLLDLSLWEDRSGCIFVVPRVPMRTVLVERGIVRVSDGHISIAPPNDPMTNRPIISGKAPRTTPSELEYFDQLAIKRPDLVEPLRAFLAELSQLGVSSDAGKSFKFLTIPTGDQSAGLGYVDTGGKYWTDTAWCAATRLGRSDVGDDFQHAIATMIGSQVKKYEKADPQVLSAQGRAPDVQELLRQSGRWKSAMADYIAALKED